ncbi:Rib/alpha-like domain-containing protein [Lactobacillus sp.]|uniref:Rib/alpha-like domain-containing protein n=1 Tax=Lactobacillus sp. TaxID=1591 RepID=UPI003EF51F68
MKKLQKAAGLAAVSLSLLAISAEPLLSTSDTAYVLAAKKTAKKSAKTTKAKRTSKKSAKKSKKSTKSTKKSTVKKTAKTAKTSKKTAKKVVKTTTKKTTKKTVKKMTAKKQTLAQKYQPREKSGVAKLTWGGAFAFSDAKNYITNVTKMPSGTYYQFEKWVDTYQSGKHVSPIKAYYTDGSSEVVGSVTFQVPEALAVKYAYFVQDLTVPVNGKIDIEKDIVTDSTIPANAAKFYFCKEDGTVVAGPDTSKAGSYEYHIKAVYTDGSVRLSGKITVTVE